MTAGVYSEITQAVAAIIRKHSGNDRQRAAYMVMRAAALIVRADQGPAVAAEKLYGLADEIATGSP